MALQNGFRASSRPDQDRPRDAEIGHRVRRVESVVLVLWTVLAWSAFGVWILTFASEAGHRFESFFAALEGR